MFFRRVPKLGRGTVTLITILGMPRVQIGEKPALSMFRHIYPILLAKFLRSVRPLLSLSSQPSKLQERLVAQGLRNPRLPSEDLHSLQELIFFPWKNSRKEDIENRIAKRE